MKAGKSKSMVSMITSNIFTFPLQTSAEPTRHLSVTYLTPLISPVFIVYLSIPEGSAVKRRWQGHDGVDDRQQTEEEDEEEQTHIEVIGFGGLEDSFVGDVGGHHRPTLVVHGAEEAENVDAH